MFGEEPAGLPAHVLPVVVGIALAPACERRDHIDCVLFEITSVSRSLDLAGD